MSFSSSFTFPFADSSLTSPPSPLSPEPADAHGAPPPSTATLFAEQLVPGKLSVAHLNARSMRPTDKFVELSNILTGTGCDIFCVTESWLDSTITDSEISILGYRVIRNDRVGRRGGGVAVYLNEQFSYQVLASSPSQYSATTEFLLLEVVVDSSKLLVAAVYHPPRAGSLDTFEEALEFFLPNYQHRFILGDFNIDLSTTSPASDQLRDRFSSLNLHILPTDTTYHSGSSHSLLDLMVVGDERRVISHVMLQPLTGTRFTLSPISTLKFTPLIIWLYLCLINTLRFKPFLRNGSLIPGCPLRSKTCSIVGTEPDAALCKLDQQPNSNGSEQPVIVRNS
ncbi:hypothetical protein M8J76_002202 [Diaphorina citri]|nr:hypothetical protein M8J76_002202 [Diaphorina citri]